MQIHGEESWMFIKVCSAFISVLHVFFIRKSDYGVTVVLSVPSNNFWTKKWVYMKFDVNGIPLETFIVLHFYDRSSACAA